MRQPGKLSSSGRQMASHVRGSCLKQETLLGESYRPALQPAAPRSRIQTSHVVTQAGRDCGRRQKSNKTVSHQLHVTHLTGLQLLRHKPSLHPGGEVVTYAFNRDTC